MATSEHTRIPTQWETEQAIRHMKIARYLLSCADERGRTHGEKHHFNFVALSEIAKALFQLAPEKYNVTLLTSYASTDPADIDRSSF